MFFSVLLDCKVCMCSSRLVVTTGEDKASKGLAEKPEQNPNRTPPFFLRIFSAWPPSSTIPRCSK